MLFNAGTCINPTTVSDIFQAVDYLSYRLKNIHFMDLAQRKKNLHHPTTLNDVPLLHRSCATAFNQLRAENFVFHTTGGVMPV